jgi:hypothetical protein
MNVVIWPGIESRGSTESSFSGVDADMIYLESSVRPAAGYRAPCAQGLIGEPLRRERAAAEPGGTSPRTVSRNFAVGSSEVTDFMIQACPVPKLAHGR